MKKIFIYIILIFVVFFSYIYYISNHWENIKIWEKNYPVVQRINNNLRETYSWAISKINPHYKVAENDIKETVDNVKNTLSWAQETIDKAWKVIEKWKETIDTAKEVINDVDKMWDWIMNSVNPNVMQ